MAEGIQSSHLTLGEETILARLREIDPARMANANPSLATSLRIADRVAKSIGSWRFVVFQTLFFAAWFAVNITALLLSWDPYPFVLLGLVLSLQAAYTAPIIIMSQNRQAALDRYRAESDYEINLHAALELKLLQQKINAIHQRDIADMRQALARIEDWLGHVTGALARSPSGVGKNTGSLDVRQGGRRQRVSNIRGVLARQAISTGKTTHVKGMIMRSDNEIKNDVESELRWHPELDATDIAVAVKNGVVALTGFTKSYSDKLEAELAAKRVNGVVGLANDIQVRLSSADVRPDPEIAREAVAAIKHQLPFSYERIKPIAKDGWVTLEGEVEWNYTREIAEKAVRRLTGIKGVINMVRVKPHVEPTEVKRKIEEALKRSAEIDSHRITVEARGGEVVLKGTVRSWIERKEAERAAWAAPGVVKVEDHITVSP